MGLLQARAAVDSANILGECPVWSVEQRCLYWVDIRQPALWRFIPSTGQHSVWPMPQLCTGVALARDKLIVALRNALFIFDPASGALRHLVDVEHASEDQRLNELRVDRAGRAWIGSMREYGAAVTGSLYCVSSELQVRRVWSDIRIPNGLGWSPDGGIMYFADSGPREMLAFAYDTATGKPGPARTLLAADGLPGSPDGSAVDSQGFVWNARYGGGCVARISPTGAVDTVVQLPVSQPTACTLGGDDLRTLYVTTASQRLDPMERARQPWAGHLLALRVPVAGVPEPEFLFAVSTEPDH